MTLVFSTGLVSVSFRKYSPEDILAAMREASLSLIEWGSDIHAPCDDMGKLRRLVELQKEYGVSCCSYGTYFRIGSHKPDGIVPYIAAAKLLGTDILRIWAGDKDYTAYSEGEKQAFTADCKTLAHIAEEEGVTLCLECHNNTFTSCARGAEYLMEHVSSAHFRMYWQPNQFLDFATNTDYAARMAPYADTIHMFHWVGDNMFSLDDGRDIWKTYLSHFTGNKKILLEFMPDGQLSTLSKEARIMREIIHETETRK